MIVLPPLGNIGHNAVIYVSRVMITRCRRNATTSSTLTQVVQILGVAVMTGHVSVSSEVKPLSVEIS